MDKIIVGGINQDGEIDPALITIIYKTGKKDSQNGKLFKGKRKNAKAVDEPNNKLYPQSGNEVETVCSYPSNHTCGDGSHDVKGGTQRVDDMLKLKACFKAIVGLE